MDSKEIKSIVTDLGADICGISNIDRFNNAPDGHKPSDIYPPCKSVIVFAKRIPKTPLFANTLVPYTKINEITSNEVDSISIGLCSILEDKGISCVNIPCNDPYEHWEEDKKYGRGILSLRHAGYFAGLGILARNNLLVNEKYGNMLFIGAVLVDIKLKEDQIVNYECCPEKCSLCIDVCPQNALNGSTVNQKLCRELSILVTEKGYTLYNCCKCRIICPNFNGIKKNKSNNGDV